MKYDFDKTPDQVGSGAIKYDAREAVFGNANIIPMWIADMDFEAAPFIYEALTDRAKQHTYGYGLHDDAYWNAYIGWLERRGGWKTERDWMDFTSGVVAGFSYAIRALTSEGDGIVIMPPIYPPFASQIEINNRKVLHNELIRGRERYEIDFADLEEKLKAAKAFILCNPHNPTGRVFTREELMRIGELCCKYDVAIISDEIHSDLIYKPNKHLHIASLDKRFAERSVTFVAPSKTFSVAGLAASIAITPGEEMRNKLRKELSYLHIQMGNLFETAAIKAAYTKGDQWVDQVCEYLDGNAGFACRFLSENLPDLKVFRPEGTYFLWIDFSGLGMNTEELAKFMSMEAGVGLSVGGFGPGSDGFMRMNLATSRTTVEKALNQISAAWNKKR